MSAPEMRSANGRMAVLRRRYEPSIAGLRGSDTAKAAGLAGAMIANNVIALGSTIVFARLLDDYGSLAALISYFLILSVAGQAMQVATAREGVLGHLGVGSGLIDTLKGWTRSMLVVTAVVTVISILLRHPIAEAVGVKKDSWAAAIGLPAGCLWLELSILRGALQGVGDYKSVGISLIGEQAARLVVGAALAAGGLGVTGAYLGTPISFIAMSIFCALAVRRQVVAGQAGPAPGARPSAAGTPALSAAEALSAPEARAAAEALPAGEALPSSPALPAPGELPSGEPAPSATAAGARRPAASGGAAYGPGAGANGPFRPGASPARARAVPAIGLWTHVKRAWAPIAGLIVIAVLQNIDIIAAKHQFSKNLASSYGATAVAAKVLIWVAIGAGFYLVPEVSRRRAAGEDPRPVLWRSLAIIFVCAVPCLLIFGLAPRLLLRIAFGPKRLGASDSLLVLGAAFTVLAATYLAIQYMLALKRTGFLVLLGAVAVAEPILLLHASKRPAGFAAVVLAVQAVGAVLAFALALRRRVEPREPERAPPDAPERVPAAVA